MPQIHTLMHKNIFTNLTGRPQTISINIGHNTVNFVDDSTNIISTPNAPEIQDYINKFYTLHPTWISL